MLETHVADACDQLKRCSAFKQHFSNVRLKHINLCIRENNKFVTISSGCATSIPANNRKASMYSLTLPLAPPTPTMSRYEFFNKLIEGRFSNWSYSSQLNIKNDDSVSMSASRTSTSSITASENNWGAQVPVDDTALFDFGVDSANSADCWQLCETQLRLKLPMPPHGYQWRSGLPSDVHRRNAAVFATLKTNCWTRNWF